MKPKICPVCGRPFVPATGSQKYCTENCARKAARELNKPNIRRRSKIKSTINPRLLYAFNFSCAVCGWHLPNWDSGAAHGCDFHHIVPVCEGGTSKLDNIVLLCPNCHQQAHAGILTKEYLRGLTKTEQDIVNMRNLWAMETGAGTYWIDYLTIKRNELKRRLALGKDF